MKPITQKPLHSIQMKLVFILSLSALIAIVLLSTTMLFNTYNELVNREQTFLHNTQDILLQNLIAPIEFDDNYSANLLLKTLQRDKDIKGAFVLDSKNKVFASYIENQDEKEILKQKILNIYIKNDKKKSFSCKNDTYLIVSAPVFIDKKYVATFVLFSSTDSLNKSIKEQFILTLILSVILFIIMVILAFKLQTIFTKPLLKLEAMMKKITNNTNYDLTLKHNYKDEFGIVFDGFNTMLSTIEEQKQKMQTAKKEIEAIHKNTQASIEYAALIQDALIPNNEYFQKFFKEYFTIWTPRDMVGGDIYLLEELRDGDECIIMYIDCTGHGVPGAFVTMLVKALERQVISQINLTQEEVSPAKILSFFNKSMKQLLKQEDLDSLSNVGFDGGILYYNKKEQIVKFSGASTPLYYIEDDELKTLKGDRYSVGYKKCDANHNYAQYTLNVKEGMQFYLSTDGYIDQNGGEKSFSFGRKRFLNIIKENHTKSMSLQKEIFINELSKYQGVEDRNDDITLIGLTL
jgi:serine phosphatase RsbU (regulator of sigma subunit)